MDIETTSVLARFFSAQKQLNELGVINSRDYIGDIGSYLCREVYGMQAPKGRSHTGYDGTIGDSRVLIRPNNCPTGTVVLISDSENFDEVIVILGPNCSLRPPGVASDIIFYRFTREEAQARFSRRPAAVTSTVGTLSTATTTVSST